MKFCDDLLVFRPILVAPRAGAWIEILFPGSLLSLLFVAPRAGAWIEILGIYNMKGAFASLPVRERGLKFCMFLVL